ncbi:MAG TPA: DUF1289 domain-containing protein [Usitatibacter sp.]|nr:DUF1289 domain-containing protein [Usitatibacter sp.]
MDRNAPSPCTGLCTLDLETDTCFGCGRTLHEIERWILLTAEERAKIEAALPQRLAQLAHKPGRPPG